MEATDIQQRMRERTPVSTAKEAQAMLATPTSSTRPTVNPNPVFTPSHLTTPTPQRPGAALGNALDLTPRALQTPASLRTALSLTPTPRRFGGSGAGSSTVESSPETRWAPLSEDDIAAYDLSQLRAKLTEANSIIANLSDSLHQARTSAAHFNLQHQLLAIQTHEAQQRHEVESAMAEREIEALRRGPVGHTSLDATTVLENEVQKRKLRKARKIIQELQEEVHDYKEDNDRLRRRLRDFAVDPRKKEESGGPSSPKRRKKNYSKQDEMEPDKLTALGLLATQVLSQEMDETVPNTPVIAPEPSTPTTARAPVTPNTSREGEARALMSPLALYPGGSPGGTGTEHESRRQTLGKRKSRISESG